jgi:hypothetical protein
MDKRHAVIALAAAIVIAGAASKIKSKHSGLLTGTIVLSGQLVSSNTLVMKGALNVGDGSDVDWQLPVAQSVQLSGYSEQVDNPQFAWSTPPDSSSQASTQMGIPVMDFHWNSPAKNQTINVTETLHVVTTTNLAPFQSSAAFPLSTLPADAQKYLAVDSELKLPSAAAKLTTKLKKGATTEQQVVSNVADWVASNLHYNASHVNGPLDATWIFQNKQAACRGYDDMMEALLRQLGIPARAEWGWVSANRLSLPAGPKSSGAVVQWSVPGTQGELHTWLSIYFPDQGWVPFDPQQEKFFVDTRHIGFWTTQDAGQSPDVGEILALWSGQPVVNSNIVPGAGLGQVTLTEQDKNSTVAFKSLTKSPNSLLMFAR